MMNQHKHWLGNCKDAKEWAMGPTYRLLKYNKKKVKILRRHDGFYDIFAWFDSYGDYANFWIHIMGGDVAPAHLIESLKKGETWDRLKR